MDDMTNTNDGIAWTLRIEQINRLYGMRAALRAADLSLLDVTYNPHTFMIICKHKGIIKHVFAAN